MTSFQEIAGTSKAQFFEYNAKCLVGVTVGYGLYKAFPEQSGQFLWILISILLSITHDNNSQVARDRMKGNVLGSLVGLFTFFLHDPPNLITICIGVAATIAICFRLALIGVSRTALVAFIIVVLYEEAHRGWEGAAYRMACVIVGCLIGLVINFVFRKLVTAFDRSIATSVAEKSASAGKHEGGG